MPFDTENFKILSPDTIVNEWTTVKDIPYLEDKSDVARSTRCQLNVFHHKTQTDTPVIVYIHGGGLSGGTREEAPQIYKNLGCVMVSPSYRIYPTAKYPDFIEDTAAALAWTKQHIAEFGGNPDKIFVAGHSAGAYLVSCLALMPEFLKAHNLTPFDFAGYIPISGSMVTHFQIQEERTGSASPITIDDTAPIYHAKKETPPLLIICGEAGLDIAGRASDNRLMAEALRATGNTNFEQYEVAGMNHSSIMDAAYAYMLQFIRSKL